MSTKNNKPQSFRPIKIIRPSVANWQRLMAFQADENEAPNDTLTRILDLAEADPGCQPDTSS